MKLGISMSFEYLPPEQWLQKHKELGLEAVIFPCTYKDPVSKIDEYVQICNENDITIAEVGAWKNIISPNEKEKKENFAFCKGQLELAEYIEACCCVNIAGAPGEVWNGAYKENYLQSTYDEIIQSVQDLIDSVKPKKTFYTLEPMPWMHPDSPEDYLKMIDDIDREAFAVHMDIINMISSPQKYLFNEQFTKDAFKMLGKKVKSCHIKDVKLEKPFTTNLKELACGEGGFNLENYIREIDALDKKMPVIVEHLHTEEEYVKALKYVVELYKQMQ